MTAEGTEGAKFWMKVFNDLKTRSVSDILIAVTDGLKGMPEALAAVFRPIYTAVSAEAAQIELEAFTDGPWGQKFPTVSAARRNAWDRVIPFFAFPPAVRRVIYTTNAIENINSQLRKIIKTRGHFPSDEAAAKLIWLALRNITARWSRSAHDWMRIDSVAFPCNAQPASNTEFLAPPSDNGLIFTSRSYTALVRSYGLRQEFITPHCPQQNGMVERVIRTLKEQCVHRHRFESLQHASHVIGDWISFYNHRRPHQALNAALGRDFDVQTAFVVQTKRLFARLGLADLGVGQGRHDVRLYRRKKSPRL